ncbi:transporter substrate-binding domain-containing protein [Shinella sp. S4-D37]|uniref:transporter substrate-binding domain-containing protein n=1 Tax=Shinella sp. S4-D37 TaxID=3161999 RepID=UPI00346721D7
MRLSGIIAVAALGVLLAGFARADTLDDVKEAGRIRVGMDQSVKPFAFRDPTSGEIVGSDVNVAKMIAADLKVSLEIVPLTAANRIPFLLSGRVDIVVSSLTRTAERMKVVAMSRPYGGSYDVIAAPKSVDIKSLEDLAGKRVAITRGTYLDQRLTALAPASTEIVRFDGEDTSLAAVTSGQFDIVAKNVAILPEIIKGTGDRGFEQKFIVSDLPMSIGMRKEDASMQKWIDDWITAHLADGSLDKAFSEYQAFSLPEFVTQWKPE